MGCHSHSGQAVPNRFSTRLHLRHVGERAAPECSACHSIIPAERFGLIGQGPSWGEPKADDLAALEEIMASWASSGFTDHLHAKVSVACGGCHAGRLPQLDDTVTSTRCLACHGPLPKLIEATRDAEFPKRNPHASHLGDDVACTVCHHAHKASTVYCAGCHRLWRLTIPGAAN